MNDNTQQVNLFESIGYSPLYMVWEAEAIVHEKSEQAQRKNPLFTPSMLLDPPDWILERFYRTSGVIDKQTAAEYSAIASRTRTTDIDDEEAWKQIQADFRRWNTEHPARYQFPERWTIADELFADGAQGYLAADHWGDPLHYYDDPWFWNDHGADALERLRERVRAYRQYHRLLSIRKVEENEFENKLNQGIRNRMRWAQTLFRSGKLSDYLHSEWWQYRRCKRLEETPFCQIDRCTEGLEVHHITYIRIGNESSKDLIVLCRPHHLVVTGMKRYHIQLSKQPRRHP